jgi:hypothetical protein
MTAAVPGAGYQIFVDESGDHGLVAIDTNFPVFVLVFCVFQNTTYARQVLPAVTEFKFKHFGHDQVILHEHDIRKDTGPFKILREPARKQAFMDDLTRLIAGFDFTIIASVIRKDRLVGQYVSPANPYELALGFGLERAYRCLSRRTVEGTVTPVILERRGRREDDELELEFRRICDGGNFRRDRLGFEPHFVWKSANVPGLQIADLVARPIGRYVLQPEQPNRAFDVIKDKLDHNAAGDPRGWGLKVFP